MADEVNNYVHHPKIEEPCESTPVVKFEEPKKEKPCETIPVAVETGDRGLFNWKKDEEKKFEAEKEEVLAGEFDEKVQVCEKDKKEETKHEGLIEKLHRSSSSSSEEEYEDENGEKKKRKKSLKEKIFGEKKEEVKISESYVPVDEKCEDVPSYEPEEKSYVPVVEKCDDVPSYEAEEKKGVFDKIKEKLPVGDKKHEEEVVVETPTPGDCKPHVTEEKEEKKGFLEKIKEKLPGFKSEEEKEKEKEKECN